MLAADVATRRIRTIECKNVQLMPHEIRSDLHDLFVGTPDSPSAQARHLARLAWLEAHLADLAAWLTGIQDRSWTVEAFMVVSRALVSPHLGKAQMPVRTLRQIKLGEHP